MSRLVHPLRTTAPPRPTLQPLLPPSSLAPAISLTSFASPPNSILTLMILPFPILYTKTLWRPSNLSSTPHPYSLPPIPHPYLPSPPFLLLSSQLPLPPFLSPPPSPPPPSPPSSPPPLLPPPPPSPLPPPPPVSPEVTPHRPPPRPPLTPSILPHPATHLTTRTGKNRTTLPTQRPRNPPAPSAALQDHPPIHCILAHRMPPLRADETNGARIDRSHAEHPIRITLA